jgi:hypothetical protein
MPCPTYFGIDVRCTPRDCHPVRPRRARACRWRMLACANASIAARPSSDDIPERRLPGCPEGSRAGEELTRPD